MVVGTRERSARRKDCQQKNKTGFHRNLPLNFHFLNKFSNACRASAGFATTAAGVDVSFSSRTLMEKNVQLFFSSLRAILSGMGCMHSNRFEVSKYVH